MSAVESWFAATAVAEPLPRQRPRRAAAAKQKPKARRPRGVRVRLPLVWMLVLALSLVGVVAVNVAVLRANVSVNNLDKQIAHRQQEIATLRSQYARATASPRVAGAAVRSGYVLAGTSNSSPLDMITRK